MTKVKKRSGEMQDLDRAKLEASIRRAGATEEIAKKVVSRVQPMDGIPTDELRKLVAEELRKEEPNLAESYLMTVRLPAKAHPEVVTGVARVPQRLPRVPEIPHSMLARVVYGDKLTEVRVEPVLQVREIWLNRGDLESLGAREGARVAVRFQRANRGPTGGGPMPPTIRQGMNPQPSIAPPKAE